MGETGPVPARLAIVLVLVLVGATEQPFTRSLSGVEIPADVTTVTVEGRDLVNGWGGGTQTVTVEG